MWYCPYTYINMTSSSSSRICSSSAVLVTLYFLFQSLLACSSFSTPFSSTRIASHPPLASSLDDNYDDASLLDKITKTYDNFQQARSDGYTFKQSMAIAIAGEYDADSVKREIQEQINSAPCVMFIWEASPSCKQAIKYMDIAGAKYKVVRL